MKSLAPHPTQNPVSAPERKIERDILKDRGRLKARERERDRQRQKAYTTNIPVFDLSMFLHETNWIMIYRLSDWLIQMLTGVRKTTFNYPIPSEYPIFNNYTTKNIKTHYQTK